MGGDIYEDDGHNLCADCVICDKRIDLDANDYFEIGAIYTHPQIIGDNGNEVRYFVHPDCYEPYADAVAERIKQLIEHMKEGAGAPPGEVSK